MSKRQRRAQRERRQRAAVAARRVGTTGGVAVVATLLSGAVADAQTFTVTNTDDTGANSLYAAIQESDAATGSSNTIVFASNVTGSIDITSTLPRITTPVTITGPGANVLTIHGNGATGIFYIGTGVSGVTISGLGMTGANKYNSSGGHGGAVFAASPVTLLGDNIYGNKATGPGSAGGAIFAIDGLAVVGSTISGNTAASAGGVDVDGGTFDVAYSTIANNTATSGKGGGIVARNGSTHVLNSTVSGNAAPGTGSGYAGDGGGIFLYGSIGGVFVYNSIVNGDTAANKGPDVYVESGVPPATVKFSSIGSTASSDITADSTDQVGMNPLLGPLQNNGGTTPTMAPAFNSPVIDKGDQPSASPESTDQRGLPRPVDLPGYPNATGGDGSDMGAVELQPSEVVPVVSGISPSSGTAATPVVISGSRLSTATGVTFGSTPVPFSVISSGQILTSAPPGGSGTVDIRVTTLGGESAAVGADQFTYKPPPPPRPPPPATQTTSATFGNQHITLTSPSACVARTSALKATLTSVSVGRGRKLRFSSAGFFVDRGIKHTKKKTKHLKNGKTKKITITTYVANAIVHHVPATVSISLTGVKSGTHTLKVVISYRETVTKHHKKKTETVTKTIRSTFTVC